MKTVNEQIVLLENQLAELKAIVNAPKPTNWMPAKGDAYWVVDGRGCCGKYNYDNDSIDRTVLVYQDPCKTKEEAEVKAERQRAIIEINRRVRALTAEKHPGWFCDWNNDKQKKCTPTCRHYTKELETSIYYFQQSNFTFEYTPEDVWDTIIRYNKKLLTQAMGITND